MHFIQKPAKAESLNIDEGIKAFRVMLDESQSLVLDMATTELLWLITRKGESEIRPPSDPDVVLMTPGNSSVYFMTRSPWQLQVKSPSQASVFGFSISLPALHDLLAVEFDEDKSKDSQAGSMDYQRLSQVITLTPRHIQDIDNVFIQSDESRFGTIARRGAFLSAFATLLETFYGKQLAQCPFHIDFDTEQKIRKAHELLVSDLQEMQDINALARETELPKTVLKEGFEYLYGKPATQYFQDYKFEKSIEMLESGKYLIRDIAFAIGFQNPSHFISAFKQRFNTTPKQWIKKRQERTRAALDETESR